jgi:hypothetical protein
MTVNRFLANHGTDEKSHTFYTAPHASQISFVTQQENPPQKMMISGY